MPYQQALRALADPTRREVLERLREGPMPVGRLASGMQVSRPAVSQHLRVLENAGLVGAWREGRLRIYHVEVRGLLELKRYIETFWRDMLEAIRQEAESRPPHGKTRHPSRKPKRRKRGRD
jgi:DNA-binding transcriptional ArsR family regulator